MCRERPGTRVKVKPGCTVIFELILTYIGIMDGSSDVERIFSRLEQAEGKRAVQHHRRELLECICKIAVDGPNDIDDLVHKNPAPTIRKACGQTRVLIAVWDPDALIKEAQKKYVEFFGGRRLKSRSLAPVPLEEKKEQLALVRPRLHQRSSEGCVAGPLQAEGRRTKWSLAQRTASWIESTKPEMNKHMIACAGCISGCLCLGCLYSWLLLLGLLV